MPSNINTNNIDEKYPVAGVDNDTEGFRTNFSEIKQNINTTKAEIDDILANTPRTDSESDFNGSSIIDANFIESTSLVYINGSKDSDFEVDFKNGHYQTIDIRGNITVTLKNWPEEERYAYIRLSIVNSGSQSFEVTWLTEQSGHIKKNQGQTLQLYDSTDGLNAKVGAFPDPFVVSPTSNEHILEFWTVDNGVTVFANYVGQFS